MAARKHHSTSRKFNIGHPLLHRFADFESPHQHVNGWHQALVVFVPGCPISLYGAAAGMVLHVMTVRAVLFFNGFGTSAA